MLVQVKYKQQQKYVKLDEVDGRFDFLQFHEKVIERFCLPPDAEVTYKDATGTEVDGEIFSDLVGQGNVVLTVFSNDEFSDWSLSSSSETSDSSSSSSTIIIDEVPGKKQRLDDTCDAESAKQVEQDFTLLFGDETSSRLLQKWDVFFKPNIIQEAKQLTSTPELRRLIQSAESSSGSDEETILCLFVLSLETCCLSQVMLQFGGASSQPAGSAAIPPCRWSSEEQD
ncbi:uncharacterized protein LOC119911613 isoform X2 [Micropterus salmoides]|uniref:uncharacterized protein LOC119911613 isoform X2 n=1 Tax=Micropterus salmoides TaxID=27706 RepID=UPI0018EB82F8|nr:uncharacterized protein LOC119911613 isoform X2 [Micropterus salmoides]